MMSRPIDSAGDILPVLSPSDLLSDVPAVAAALSDHLRLFSGDWWEKPDSGNEIFDLVSGSVIREKDLPALAGYLSSYIQSFPPIQSVSDVHASLSGSTFRYSATAHISGGGEVPVSFSYP